LARERSSKAHDQAADDGGHLVSGGSQMRSHGFLRFVVPDHFDGIGDQVFNGSHCLMSSAVTHVGRLPRKTVKLIQLIF
jgi:hypothetical protein